MSKSDFIVFIFLFFIGNFSYAQKFEDDNFDKIDSLFSKVNNDKSPGAAVLVVKDDKVIFNKGYGMASLEHSMPISPATVFDIASLSKQFVGMAIAMLIEDGKISKTDDIRKYLPEMPDFGQTITIDHLIHHTSGLRDWTGTFSLAGNNINGIVTFGQVLNMAYNQKELNFIPGSEYSYSNTGYNLLAKIVQRASGEEFPKWAKENIFQPLQMNDTHFRDDYTAVVHGNASSYFWWEDTYYTTPNNLTAIGSSALHTTTEDLAKWLLNLHTPAVGGQSIVARMFETGILNNGDTVPYAFGLAIDDYRGYKEIHHSGGWVSFSTYLAHFPEENLSVVVLNNYPANTHGDAHKIIDLFLPKNENNKPKNDSEPKTLKLPVSELEDFIGTYRLRPGWYLEISLQNDTLMTQSLNENKVPMMAISSNKFWVDDYGGYIEFSNDSVGQVSHLTYQGRTGVKVEPNGTYNPENLGDYIGDYFSEELSVYFRVEIKGSGLIAKNNFHNVINLVNKWNEDFKGDRWFMDSIEFYRNDEGKISGFLVSDRSGRSRNQRFIKIKVSD